MSETKHTPGPWIAIGYSKGENAKASGHKNCWRIDSPDMTRLAELKGADSSARTSIGADAHLIAAAPEMLAVLERVHTVLLVAGNWPRLTALTEEAIANAKGESND